MESSLLVKFIIVVSVIFFVFIIFRILEIREFNHSFSSFIEEYKQIYEKSRDSNNFDEFEKWCVPECPSFLKMFFSFKPLTLKNFLPPFPSELRKNHSPSI